MLGASVHFTSMVHLAGQQHANKGGSLSVEHPSLPGSVKTLFNLPSRASPEQAVHGLLRLVQRMYPYKYRCALPKSTELCGHCSAARGGHVRR